MQTIKELRTAMGWTLHETMRFLDQARRYGLQRYPHLFEIANYDGWDLPDAGESAEAWYDRNIQARLRLTLSQN